MTLRVLHVAPVAPGGGTSVFIRRQIDRLAEAGVEGRTVFFSGYAMWSRPAGIFGGVASIRRERRAFRPDIVHAHWGSLLAFASALATIGGPPLVITFRGSDLNPVPSEAWAMRAARVAFSQCAALRAAAAICVSDELRGRLWFRRAPVGIVPDGTDLSLFRRLDKLECRRELGWPPDERVVFFHEGGRASVKRRDLADAGLREAGRILGRCRLEVMGTDVPHDQVPLRLNASDCLLVTSDYEGSPNIVREALACGVPIVSVEVGDVRRWLADLEGTRIVERDPAEIGRALAELIAAGVRPDAGSITSLFDEESSRDAVLEIYRRAMEDSKKQRRS